MRRLFSLILFVLCTLAVNAGPAQPGIWRTLTLPDGTTIEAELCGDEFVHYWRTTGDKLYIPRVVVVNSMQAGNWLWDANTSNHLTLRWNEEVV